MMQLTSRVINTSSHMLYKTVIIKLSRETANLDVRRIIKLEM